MGYGKQKASHHAPTCVRMGQDRQKTSTMPRCEKNGGHSKGKISHYAPACEKMGGIARENKSLCPSARKNEGIARKNKPL